MDSKKVNRWLTLGANIGVLVGIIILAIEIQQNSDHLALQLEFQATQKIFENNRDLQNPGRALIFGKAITQPEELTFEEGLVATSIVINLLNEWEDRYFIHQAGLIGQIDWKRHIKENIDWTLGNQFALECYKSNRSAFEPEFVEYVDSLLASVAKNGTYDWWTNLQSSFSRPDAKAN